MKSSGCPFLANQTNTPRLFLLNFLLVITLNAFLLQPHAFCFYLLMESTQSHVRYSSTQGQVITPAHAPQACSGKDQQFSVMYILAN